MRKTSERLVYHSLKEIMFQYGIGFRSTSQRRYYKKERKKIKEFIVDETLLKVGNEYVWIWVAIEPIDKLILDIHISFERTMLIAERFLKALIRRYGKHPLSTDGWTWYPQACSFLKIDHHIHSPYEKSIIERTVQYLKDRTAEMFDDYFPCRKYGCKLEHTKHWLNLFVDMHNDMVVGRMIK